MDDDKDFWGLVADSEGTDNVHKTYLLGIEGIAALRGVSMGLRRWEFVCIFGISGGGKTRLCVCV
jgi:ABC-type lipoprotein export system ATPase subunit